MVEHKRLRRRGYRLRLSHPTLVSSRHAFLTSNSAPHDRSTQWHVAPAATAFSTPSVSGASRHSSKSSGSGSRASPHQRAAPRSSGSTSKRRPAAATGSLVQRYSFTVSSLRPSCLWKELWMPASCMCLGQMLLSKCTCHVACCVFVVGPPALVRRSTLYERAHTT